MTETTEEPQLAQIRARHLRLGLPLFLLFATADTLLTLHGTAGELAMEGNPVMRQMMASLGHAPGLVVEKLLVLLAVLGIAMVSSRGIHREANWVYYLALTPLSRRWMHRKRRYWIAFVPLHLATLSQALAAGSWLLLLFYFS